MENIANKIEAVLDVKYEVLYLHEQLLAGPTAVYPVLERRFEELVEGFYRLYSERITMRQYQTARNNYEYFMVLIEQTLNGYRDEESKDKQEAGEGK